MCQRYLAFEQRVKGNNGNCILNIHHNIENETKKRRARFEPNSILANAIQWRMVRKTATTTTSIFIRMKFRHILIIFGVIQVEKYTIQQPHRPDITY